MFSLITPVSSRIPSLRSRKLCRPHPVTDLLKPLPCEMAVVDETDEEEDYDYNPFLTPNSSSDPLDMSRGSSNSRYSLRKRS